MIRDITWGLQRINTESGLFRCRDLLLSSVPCQSQDCRQTGLFTKVFYRINRPPGGNNWRHWQVNNGHWYFMKYHTVFVLVSGIWWITLVLIELPPWPRRSPSTSRPYAMTHWQAFWTGCRKIRCIRKGSLY